MYGRRVLSEVPLPVPALPESEAARPDWVIRRSPPSTVPPTPPVEPMAELRAPDGRLLDRFSRTGDEAWLWDDRAGLCHIEPSVGRVTVYPAQDVDEDDLALLLIGAVASFLLHQSGTPALHASAVVTQYGACAFVGPSTLGKSTLAAGLLKRGAHLLTDDLLPLHVGGEAIAGMPGPALMKLWPTTAQGALGIATELPRLTGNTEKRLLDPYRHRYPCADSPAPLRAIYLPHRYDPVAEGRADVTVEPLPQREAVLLLLSQTFRGHYLYPGELAVLLGQMSRLAAQARVAVLRLPHGLEHQSMVSEHILRDLQDLAAS